jgi:hypothetical protein
MGCELKGVKLGGGGFQNISSKLGMFLKLQVSGVPAQAWESMLRSLGLSGTFTMCHSNNVGCY